ncbi:DNA-methyltransferase [Neisseria sp. Ec49-e6-T10]|uniref:DNA-methyltransferase n=1 Tax=Neisseria sp. Ec49-e6-T10 TaxID=3140744 RepID=UPI003EBE62BB
MDTKLYLGDCLKLMSNIEDSSIDLILCDLPYGTTQCDFDKIIPFAPLWEHYKRIIKNNGAIVLTAQSPFDKLLACSNLDMLRYEWIWEKTAATGHLNAKKMPLKAHENILVFSELEHEHLLVFYKNLPIYRPQKTSGHKPVNSYTKHKSDGLNYGQTKTGISGGGSTERYPRSVIRIPTDKQKSALHPQQKPVALMEYLINTYTNKGDIVLDNCMGSGTTGVACLQTKRKFIGIEKDPKYFEIAQKRLTNEISKLKADLFY